MEYISAISWILIGLIPIHGFLFLGTRRERVRNTRMMRELQRRGIQALQSRIRR